MLRIMKLLTALAITALLFPVRTVEAATYSFSVNGTKKYTEAYEVLNFINKERSNAGLSALAMDDTMLEAAMLRAAECAVSYSHTRPNGSSALSVLPAAAGTVYRSENINIGNRGAEGTVATWMGSEEHKNAILSNKYKSTGIGVFVCNGYSYWVELFSSETAKAPSVKYDKTGLQSISASDSIINKLNFENGSISLVANQSLQTNVNIYNYNRYVPIDSSSFTWTPVNGTYASVNSSGLVTGKKAGTQTIQALLKNSSKKCSLTVNVTNGLVLNSTNFPDSGLLSIVDNWDYDNNGSLSETELSAVTRITIDRYTTVNSLKGLELLPNLNSLTISGTGLTDLEIGGFGNLHELNIWSNSIETASVHDCPVLDKINCESNKNIQSLLISNCVSLTTILSELAENLEEIKVINLNQLKTFELWKTKVTVLDVSSCSMISNAVQKGTYKTVANIYADRVHGEYDYNDIRLEPHKDVTVITYGGLKYKNGVRINNIGWDNKNGHWYYYDQSGNMKTGWLKVSGKWYYLDSSGIMITGWRSISGIWYYFESSGAMVTGWKKISNIWYYFDNSGAMKNGWQKINNIWYYFESSGAMLANTSKTIKGKTYRFDASGKCLNP